jgi:hypothetical protein
MPVCNSTSATVIHGDWHMMGTIAQVTNRNPEGTAGPTGERRMHYSYAHSVHHDLADDFVGGHILNNFFVTKVFRNFPSVFPMRIFIILPRCTLFD